MHAEARAFVELAVARHGQPSSVLEVGGRNVNGSIRDLFDTREFVALDVSDGPGVDLVADAAEWEPASHPLWPWALVVSCETFEHAPRWRQILATMAAAVRRGGGLIVTAATDPRAAHSALDGWELRDGEWYENVDPGALADEAERCGLEATVSTHPRGDVYLWGVKR